MSRSWVHAAIVGILLLTTFLRFARYPDRWGLAYDQAHDAVVARGALHDHKIPLVGPFSSAGPFQTSGVWYWIIMSAYFFFPSVVTAPWILLTIVSIVFVYLLIQLGAYLFSPTFGLLVGVLAAISTAQVAQSVNMTNQTPLAMTSLLALWCFCVSIQRSERIYLFGLGFFAALSASIHLQGIALLVLLPLALIWRKDMSLRSIISEGVGYAIAFVPLILWDATHNFSNLRNILTYAIFNKAITYEQLGRSWKWFLLQYLPSEWSHVLGGRKEVFFIIISALLGITVIGLIQKKSSKGESTSGGKRIELGIIFALFSMFIIIRYVRTPIYSSYIVFLHPFILLTSGFALWKLLHLHTVLGIICFILVIFFTVQNTLKEVNYGTNMSDEEGRTWRHILLTSYPNISFHVYDLGYNTAHQSLVLTLYLDVLGKIKEEGMAIGIASYSAQQFFPYPVIIPWGDKAVYNLTHLSYEQRIRSGWVSMTPRAMYRATEEWVK